MKKFKFLTLALVSLLVCGCAWSCSDDDDDNNNGNSGGSSGSIVGVWELNSYVVWEKCDGQIEYGSTQEKRDLDMTLCFYPDGTGEAEYGGYYEEFEWEYSKGEIIFESDNGSAMFEGKYTVNTLNSSKLSIEQTQKYNSSGHRYEDYFKFNLRKINDYDEDDEY